MSRDFISHDVPERSIRSPMRSVTRSSVRRPAALIAHMWIDLYKERNPQMFFLFGLMFVFILPGMELGTAMELSGMVYVLIPF
jgi:hypothetical protein